MSVSDTSGNSWLKRWLAKFDRPSTRTFASIFIVLLVFILAGVTVAAFNPQLFSEGVFWGLIASAFGALASQVFWQIASKPDLRESLELAIGDSLTFRRDHMRLVLGQKEAAERGEIVKELLGALIDGPEAVPSALYQEVIEPQIGPGARFRDLYKYTITLRPFAPGEDAEAVDWLAGRGLVASAEDFAQRYCWVEQDFASAWSAEDPEEKEKTLETAFTFSWFNLDPLLDKNDVFLRELAQVDQAFREGFRNLSEGDLPELLSRVMRFEAFPLDIRGATDARDRLALGPKLLAEYKGFHVTTRAPVRSGREGLRIRFRLPHLRSENSFLATIVDPTKDPRISFFCEDPGQRLNAFSFLNPRSGAASLTLEPDASPNRAFVQPAGWVFPRAGAVFTWHPKA